MAASSGFMIAAAERRFPVRIRIGVPPDGLGSRLDRIKAWLDENCGANGLGAEKSGVGAVSIRRREAVVPFRGPESKETCEPSPSR